jgi:hypothetical protein
MPIQELHHYSGIATENAVEIMEDNDENII